MSEPVCQNCKRPADEKSRCWHCHNRPCEKCGRMTGSAFLALCMPCDMATEVEKK